MKQPEIITFGCRLNTYETEIIRKLVNNANLKNTIVINTCAVTAEAERQAEAEAEQKAADGGHAADEQNHNRVL